MPPKTVIEKSQSSSSGVTVFKIAGTLGFHEKDTLEKLFSECKKRDMVRLVFDFSELTSLGGGCARIIRGQASHGELVVGVAGAKKTVLKFLLEKQGKSGIIVCAAVPEAVSAVLRRPTRGVAIAAAAETPSDDELVSDDSLDELLGVAKAGAPETEKTPEWTVEAPQPTTSASEPTTEAPTAAVPAEPESEATKAKELRRRIIQYNTLFSINTEFAQIPDRKNLIDIFLLTTIAQVGVESAIFLEENQGYFIPASSKGVEAAELRGLAIARTSISMDTWIQQPDVFRILEAPIDDEARAPLMAIGSEYVAPFIVYGELRGLLVLGSPIRRPIDETTAEFLKLFVSQVAIAYQSLSKFEEENERTLGLVQTLMSLIEENTAARGNTQMLSNYVYVLATQFHFPEEKIRDLMYGCALRDIGMIKVGHIIVRSPRELMPEEWEIIKRHPGEGAEMLQRMKFSEAAQAIVLAHHERFNGEGYPAGTQGKDIPLGARIISVVESYTAMLQERPTRPALTQSEAINTLKENWGMRYDPEIVTGFMAIVEQELQSGEKVVDRKFELYGV